MQWVNKIYNCTTYTFYLHFYYFTADRANIVAKDNVFTLEVASVKAEDKGNYTCRITNANGEAVACSANLDVHQCKN